MFLIVALRLLSRVKPRPQSRRPPLASVYMLRHGSTRFLDRGVDACLLEPQHLYYFHTCSYCSLASGDGSLVLHVLFRDTFVFDLVGDKCNALLHARRIREWAPCAWTTRVWSTCETESVSTFPYASSVASSACTGLLSRVHDAMTRQVLRPTATWKALDT